MKATLKLALEALQAVQPECDDFHHKKKEMHDWSETCKPLERYKQTITDIKEALSSPNGEAQQPQSEARGLLSNEQVEPVAWVVYSSAENDIVWADKGKRLKQNTPLYTHPQNPQRSSHKAWVSLSDEEMWNAEGGGSDIMNLTYARAIEAKLRELNEAPAKQQRKPLTDWIDPNDKAQERFLPNIGEPVLFCHEGKTYYGKHNGGSFQPRGGIKRYFNTWECRWMRLPAAHGIKEQP